MICLVLIMPTEQEERQFVDICKKGDVESVKTLLSEDPSLIYSSNVYGKL